jgi:putative nucleotidyltransferase with HDIG domain
MVLTAASYRFPIHLRFNMKLYMCTVLLFVLAAATGPAIACILAVIGTLAREILSRKQTGAFASDITTAAGISGLNVLFTSIFIHANLFHSLSTSLILGAAVYWLIEALSLPLMLCPISGEPPLAVVHAYIRNAGGPDAVQLVLGTLAALILGEHPWALALLPVPAYFVYAALKNVKEMRETTAEILARLADAVDLRDSYTGGHSRRVATLTSDILKAMGKGGAEAELVTWAARVHDIGKIGIGDSVLLKDGRLTDEEQTEMQTHPDKGAEFLRQHREFARGTEIVRHHHERWDGAGYPLGLKEHAIPWGARIVAVADSYDAMTTDRPYRRGLSVAQARRVLIDGRGSQWDPEIIDAFIQVLDTTYGVEPAEESLENRAVA